MAICPFARWAPVQSHGGLMISHLGAVVHVTTNHADPFGFFSNPRNQASSHFWISDTGALEQMVDTSYASWAQAAGNSQYVSVEVSGTVDQPMNGAQIQTFARLYAWGMGTYGWPAVLAEQPGQRGLIWHGAGGMAWGGHLECPGALRKSQRLTIVQKASGHVTAPAADIPSPQVVSTVKDKELGIVVKTLVMIPVANGGGNIQTQIPFAGVVGIFKQGSDPQTDSGYWGGEVGGQERGGNLLISITDAKNGDPENLQPFAGQAGVFVTTAT